MPDPFPRPHLPARVDFADDVPMVQIAVPPVVAESLQSYLRERDFYLHAIPTSEDDLPTYGVGVAERARRRAAS